VADLFPTDPRRIRDRIRRYERALQRELDLGDGRDGYGKRYVLGPLYMLLGDVDGVRGVIRLVCRRLSRRWRRTVSISDVGTGAIPRRTPTRSRPHALPHHAPERLSHPLRLGHHPHRLDIWHGSKREWPEYAAEIPQALLNLWDDVALQWARDISEHPPVTAKVARYVEIHRQLKDEPRGPRRSALVRESLALRTAPML
jgi:hypothetical protein